MSNLKSALSRLILDSTASESVNHLEFQHIELHTTFLIEVGVGLDNNVYGTKGIRAIATGYDSYITNRFQSKPAFWINISESM